MTAPAAEAVVPYPRIDPTKDGQIICAFGRKGSGKSVWVREAFRHWPGVERIVVDPTGDADPGSPRRPNQPSNFADDLNTQTLRELPKTLPPRRQVDGRSVPGVYRWIANPLSPSFKEDLDRAVGLALFPKNVRTLLWVDEATHVFPANATGPYASTLLHQSRHFHSSALICCPRPMNLDPLVLAQADRVVMFDVPGASDRKRLSDVLAWPHGKLVTALDEVRTLPHHYLMYVASEHAMYLCPPIPRT